MDFGYSYFLILLASVFIITFTLVALHYSFLSTKKITVKDFFKRQYYLLKKMIFVPSDMYLWLYSVFFDSTKDFKSKYSKYKEKKTKQQYTHNNRFKNKYQYTNFNNTEFKENNLYEQIFSNNTFTNDPAYNQFFLDSSYDVLGIPYNSDFEKVTRPAYIKLINKYHQDKISIADKKYHNELFNEISKRINVAYDILKRKHISDKFR